MTELKTLKDLEKKYIASVGYGDGDYLATEDKYTEGEGHLIEIEDLKAEAVKWVKKLEEEDNYNKHGYSDLISLKDFNKTEDYENGVGISWAECSDIKAIINFIKHFFNISEEDLK